jgi:hypothetical protein
MSEIIAAIDETGANTLLGDALQAVGTLSKSGNGNLGPFGAAYTVHGSFTSGAVDLIPPDTIRIDHLHFAWHADLSFSIDLNDFLPHFCLPQVCIDIPCVGEVCTPEICIDWPTIHVPTVSFGDFVEATADFGLDVALTAGNWKVQIVVKNVSQLQFGPGTAAILGIIAAAITPLLLAVPFIGPFLAIAVDAIIAAIGIAGLTGLLGPIISPFISGLRVPVYDQPKHFQLLAAAGANDPAVFIEIDSVQARIEGSDEDELVLDIDISA